MSTQTLSAGRPGSGSTVVQDDAVARTVAVAGVGTVQTGTSGGGGGGTTAISVMVLA
jgi:hypothetical protein